MFSFKTKRIRLGLRTKVIRVVVAGLLGSLLVPIVGITSPQSLPTAEAAVSNGSISVPNSGALRINWASSLNTVGATFETWVNFTSIAGQNGIFAGCNDAAPSGYCRAWEQGLRLIWSSGGRFNLAINDFNGDAGCNIDYSAPATNTWYHIALSIPTSAHDSRADSRLFVNGIQAGTCNLLMKNPTNIRSVALGGGGNSSNFNKINFGPTRISNSQRYTTSFSPLKTFPTTGDASAWAVLNTPFDSDNASSCTAISDPNSRGAALTTFGQLDLFMANGNGTNGGGTGTATLTCSSSQPALSVATLSSATIKGVTPTLGTPNATLISATPGTVTLTAAQATGVATSTFTKTDAGATSKIVKYSSGATASTTNFDAATDLTSGTTTTLSNGDYFIIKVTAEDGTTVNYYRINVTAPNVITTANVVITAPLPGATPQTTTSSNGQFTTTIAWAGSPTTFPGATSYTAQVTVVPDSGFTLTGVAANFFTVNGNAATTPNSAGAGVFSYIFRSENSICFNGSNWLSLTTNTNLPTGNTAYTIEAFFRASTSQSGTFTNWGSPDQNASGHGRRNVLQFTTSAPGPGYIHWSQGTPSYTQGRSRGDIVFNNSWHHVVAQSDGSNVRIYENGILVAAHTRINDVNKTDNFVIGTTGSGSNGFVGCLSNLRIVSGVAIYDGVNTATANFVVPTSNLTATQEASSNIRAITGNQTVLLMNRTSNILSDASNFGYTLTQNNSPTISYSGPFVKSIDATLSGATIKGVNSILGTPNSTLASATAGTAGSVNLTTVQATGTNTTTFTKTDAGAAISRIVKYGSAAATTNFETDAVFTNGAASTVANGDFFIIKVTAENGTTVNYYRINVTAASNIATLSSATIKGVTPTLGTPNSTLISATPGTVTVTTAQATSTSLTSTFTKTDTGSTTKIVKYSSGATASTTSFDTATDLTSSTATTVANGDFFIIKVTAENGTTVNFYRINVTFSTIATLSSATIKGVTPTLGTPNATLISAIAGTVTLTAAQATGVATSTFTKTDTGSTTKIVKYSSGTTASTTSFDAATDLTSGTTTTLSNGDYFIIKVTAEDGTTVNYYRINVTAPIAITTANVVITAPVTGATPQTSTTSNDQYTTTITWSETPTTFAASTAYTATVTVVPVTGRTLSGVAANFFTLNGNAATNANTANEGVFSYLFPATFPVPTISSLDQTLPNYGSTVIVTGTNLSGATVVKIGNTPVATFTVISATSLSFVVNSPCCTVSTVSITTPGGTVTSVATITPQPQLAVITTQPVAVSKNVGQSVTFSVVVSAPLDGGVLSYQWINGTTPIQNATSTTFTFTPTALSQAGNYYVAVYNTVSGSTSLRASNTAVLTLGKATPVLSAFAAVNKTFGDAPFTITAPTSSVPGSFSYGSGTTSVATVSGSTITIVGQGSSVITATFTPQNTDDYVSGGAITMTLTVAARQLATPTLPTVDVTASTLKSFTVNWSAVTNAVAYSLRIYAADGVTLIRTVSSLSGTSKLVNATDFPAITDGTTYKVGMVATGDSNNTNSALSTLSTSFVTNAQYSITYNTTNSTGGTAPASATFITGSSPYLISANTGNLARTGFSFAGWNTAADGNGTPYLATGLVPVSLTANLVLHPKWTASKFTVTYFGNNNTFGTAPTDSTEYLNGASATILGVGTLVRRGFNFTGWTTDAANTSAVIAASSSRTINSASIQLYAKWQAIPYTVRYNSQGGSTVTSGSYTVGSSIALPANPTRAGHTFNGWFANSTGGTALTSPYSPPAVVTNWSLIYQSTQPYRTSTTGPYVYTTGFGLGATDAAQTLLNAGRTFNKVRYRMEATYNGTLYYADVSFDKWSGGGTPSSVTPTIDKLAIPASVADAVQTNVTGCVIDSNWPGFTGVASSVTNGTGKTCRLEVWFDNYTFTTSPLLPAGTGSHDQNDTRAGISYYGSFQVHNVTSGQIQTVMAWNKHYDPTNPDLGFGSRSGTQDTDWSFAGKTNFDLATWKLQIFIDDAATTPTDPTIGNIDLYAQWTPIQYTVTYNGNLSDGGNAPTNATTYITGVLIPVVGNTGGLTKAGHTFSNWALNSQGTGTVYASGSNYTVGTSNVTFYARWIANLYSVTYNATSSTGGSAPTDTSTYTIGQNIPVRGNLGSLVRTGYTFGGWTDNSGGTGTVYQSGNTYPVASSNVSFHPKWTPNSYTITYNKNGASGLPTAPTATYISGGDAVTLTSVGTMAKIGFNFGGWSTTSTGPAISGTYTTTADVILYAVWTIKSIAVTYSEGSATRANLSGFPSNTSGNYGTTITLNGTVSSTTIIDSAQHAFMGWSDGSSVYQRGSTYLLGETSPTFTAIWAKIFAVRYAFNGGTPAAGTTDTDSECLAAGSTCTDGQVITAHAAPTRTGYTFAGWIDQNNVAVTGTTFTVASNRYLLYATWTAENYAITYNTAGGSTPEASFTKQLGQSFTVAAAPTKIGNTFTGWSDGSAVVNPGVTYNVSTSPVTLTAQWTTNVYTISYDANGGSGSAIANVSYTYGANAISLPAVGDLVRINYTFAGWSETPTGASVGATYTPTMSRTLYVVWTISQYLVTYAGNGGTSSTASATYSPGSSSLVLPTATRANFTFQGWYSAATDGVLIGLAGATYAPASATTIYARWIQDSLVGVPASSLSFISSYAVNPAITATSTFSTSDSAVTLTVPAGSLPAGTTVTNWLLSTDEYARALLPGQNNYVLSLVVSWLNVDGTVPVAPSSNPLVMTITNSSIKAGARVYSVVGTTVQLLGVATQDGSVSVTMTTDPQIYVVQTKPGAPTNVVATSGDQSSSVVSWNAPADDGGSTIINYTVTASDGQSCISSTTTCNFSGLTNGTSYTFTVSATNGIGTSDQSAASAAITPGAPVAAVIPKTPAPVAVITTGNTAGSQVATFPTGATEAIIPATVSLPATKLSFTGTAPLSVTITPLSANPVPSSAAPFTSSGSSKFVDIQTSGTFTGSVTICMDGDSIDYIFHFTSGAWVELPSRTFANGQVCAVTTNFSPFVVAARSVSTTPTVTTPSTPVAPAPVRAAFVKAQVPPQITKSADKFVCTPGTYSSGFTLDGVVEQGTTSVFTPVSYIYNLLFNLVVQSSISVTTTKNSATWDQSLAPAGSLVTCSVTVTNNSLTATESSIQNTAATSAALAAQKQSITSAEAEYKVALSANSRSYQKALVDNRAKWRADIAQNKATYEAERDRIKKMAASKTKNTLASAALKKYTAAQRKITSDYKDSGPAAVRSRDLSNKTALDAKNAAIAKANSTYSSIIESSGFGVLVP